MRFFHLTVSPQTLHQEGSHSDMHAFCSADRYLLLDLSMLQDSGAAARLRPLVTITP
jgi:hypothetical protein